jgi:hypothetical protein
MVNKLKQQKSKKIVKKKVTKVQDSSPKDNLDVFDSSIVVNNNLDKCALCKVRKSGILTIPIIFTPFLNALVGRISFWSTDFFKNQKSKIWSEIERPK